MEAQNVRPVIRAIKFKQQCFASWLKRLDFSNQRHEMSLRVEGPVERGRQFEYAATHWGGHWVCPTAADHTDELFDVVTAHFKLGQSVLSELGCAVLIGRLGDVVKLMLDQGTEVSVTAL
ncbi:hypothetical protein K0038_02866 [Pseudomonas syringae]|nr:hypothetical protein [Pseudomonas syringae]